MMKRWPLAVLLAAVCLCWSGAVSGQNPMSFFNKPNIADIFKPEVGNGGLYEQQRGSDEKKPPTQMEMTIVGKEMVDGQQGWWMEVGIVTGKTNEMMYSKMLVTKDFQFKKIVFQQPGQPAMEMPFDFSEKHNDVKDELEKWHQVGSESITVPAGTLRCAHWKKESGVGEAWISDKVSPMGLVKTISDNGSTMTLVKIITGASDHITGPVTKFDPQAFVHKKPQ
jgi:hypothetical protein